MLFCCYRKLWSSHNTLYPLYCSRSKTCRKKFTLKIQYSIYKLNSFHASIGMGWMRDIKGNRKKKIHDIHLQRYQILISWSYRYSSLVEVEDIHDLVIPLHGRGGRRFPYLGGHDWAGEGWQGAYSSQRGLLSSSSAIDSKWHLALWIKNYLYVYYRNCMKLCLLLLYHFLQIQENQYSWLQEYGLYKLFEIREIGI